jgi:hypothetical protein
MCRCENLLRYRSRTALTSAGVSFIAMPLGVAKNFQIALVSSATSSTDEVDQRADSGNISATGIPASERESRSVSHWDVVPAAQWLHTV